MLTHYLQLEDSTDCAARRKVLLVSPHFPPVNAPDHQRIRIALPHFKTLGWDATVLTVEPDESAHPQDSYLSQVLPDEVDIVTVPAIPAKLTRKIGLGNLGLRCWPYLYRAGQELLQQGNYDLVFFSTTMFPVMTLGPLWLKQFQVPYITDFQDPWRVDKVQQKNRTQQRPGGRIKYAIDKGLARWLEPIALRRVSHIVSVSPAYPATLQQRYAWLMPKMFTVLPFGAPTHDYAQLPELNITQSIFDPDDGYRHWVYVGRGGRDMDTALTLLFDAIHQQKVRSPTLWAKVKLHFVGTSYDRATQSKPIEALAHQHRIADIVSEHPQRIPYFEAQQVLVDSDAILLIGSDDPSYSASKLYTAVLAKRPLLAIFHQQSLIVDIIRQCKAGDIVTFDKKTCGEKTFGEKTFGEKTSVPTQSLLTAIHNLVTLPIGSHASTQWSAFSAYSAENMTKTLCQCFDAAVSQKA